MLKRMLLEVRHYKFKYTAITKSEFPIFVMEINRYEISQLVKNLPDQMQY